MQKKEVCWNITTKCNQNCRYCHRFLNISDLSLEDNKKILENLIKDNITDITWTGGEALLYPGLIELVKMAKEKGIKNKLITNGVVLANSEKSREIFDYLDNITLSIDSTNNDINCELGRGEYHYSNIKKLLEFLKDKNIDITINTVVNKKNIDTINELGSFLSGYNIKSWRVFKFMPLRETAVTNKMNFEISEEQFEKSKNIFRSFKNIPNVEFRTNKDMENKYVLLVANGDIIETENGKDIKKGNAMYKNLMEFMD